MNAATVLSLLDPLLVIGAMAAGAGAMATFFLLFARVAELNRDGDRQIPRFRGSLFFLWPPMVFEWLAVVIDRSRNSDYYKWELRLARACRLLLAAFYLLWATGFVRMAL